MACNSGKHPLYTCRKLRLLLQEQMMAILNDHKHCINSLQAGHLVKQCPCGQKCRKCQKPHYTWVYIDTEAQKQTKWVSPSSQTPGTVTHHSHLGTCGRHLVVLVCQVQIEGADSSTTKARALLDSASSTLLIMENLAHHLRLQHWHHSMKVDGIGRSATQLSSCGMLALNM